MARPGTAPPEGQAALEIVAAPTSPAGAADSNPPWRQVDHGSSLTRDLLLERSRRLQLVSLVGLLLWLFFFSLDALAMPALRGDATGAARLPVRIATLLGITLSACVFLLGRRRLLVEARFLDVGLLFMVATSGLIAVFDVAEISRRQSFPTHGICALCLWLLVYPMIVSSSRGKMLVTALLSASMDPLVYALFHATGWYALPAAPPWNLHWLTNFLCAGLALIPAHIEYRLRQKVQRAREVGSYALETLVGRGGMGEVWRARHAMLARPAALKIIRPDNLGTASPKLARQTLRRFAREAQSAAALSSPHAIEIFDFGLRSDGTFYYVMELLQGFDLDQLVKRFGPLPPERVIHILAQACHALDDAHQSGLVHRDVKPANLFVCRRGRDRDFTKVLDFGLVKRTARGDSETIGSAPLTASGTPGFMAPEQVLDEATVDHRADLYALGCVGYWLLTGRLVFEADSPLAMLVQHVHEQPLAPSKRVELPVPADLEALLLACLQKQPQARPRSAWELRTSLLACTHAPLWTQERAARWWHAHAPEQQRPGETLPPASFEPEAGAANEPPLAVASAGWSSASIRAPTL